MAFNNLLNQTITHYPKSSLNKYGRESVGSASTLKGRVQPTTKSRLLPTGQTVLIELIIFLKGSETVNIGDKIVYSGTSYKVFGKKVGVDGRGNNHHIQLELTKWQI